LGKPGINPTSAFFKNRGTFSFTIHREKGVTTAQSPAAASADQTIQLFLNGVIYNHTREQLLAGFASQGADFIRKVEGSFVIFLLVDQSQFYILTDKVNSMKAFYTFLDDVWYVSNDIDSLPVQKCRLSIDGIACYLANGVMLNDLTLFQEIRSASRASSSSFKNAELTVSPYWEYQFDSSSSSIHQKPRYQAELETLMIDSVKRRCDPSADLALSLSAGKDSRGILGILAETIRAPRLTCFSYSLTTDPPVDSDAFLSRELAARSGVPHQIIGFYTGNLIDLLKANARQGKCLANFCDELDAWHRLALANRFTDIFVADECFGWNVAPYHTKEDVINSVYIVGAAGIRWLEPCLSKEFRRQMRQCLDKLIDDIYDRARTTPDHHDKRDFLYLDQRVNHVLMPWREYFVSQVGWVHNPYLDGSILDFMKKIPPPLRRNKSIFYDTISAMFPGLYAIKRAASTGTRVDWQAEFSRNKHSLISLVQGTESRLDEIISREEIVDFIRREDTLLLKAKVFLAKALKYLGIRSRFADRVFTLLLGPRLYQKSRNIDPVLLLLRLLLIRIYLSPP
jgi:asparagine synthase (glutamine-hydrolysing)